MKKRIVAVAFTLLLVASGCATQSKDTPSTEDTTTAETAVTVETTAATVEVTTETEAMTSVPTPITPEPTTATEPPAPATTAAPATTVTVPPSQTTTQIAVSTNPPSHYEPTPIPEFYIWDSLYGEKEWTFFSTDADRQDYPDASAFVCRFSAGQDSYADISVEFFCLLDDWKYPLNDDLVIQTMNGQEYVRILWSGYRGSLYSIVGSEDIVTLELRCYDATGHNWLTDELGFKRTDNNTLQLTSGDYAEFNLKNGDVFVR